MIKGFFRLAVVATFLIWIVTAVMVWRETDKGIWRVERNISPYLRGVMSTSLPSDDSWPVFAATPKFLALSDSEKVNAASDLYEQHVRYLERWYFVGNDDALKKWFLATARLSLNDAPIRYFPYDYQLDIAYRGFYIPGINIAPRMSYVLFSKHVLTTTTIIAGSFVFLLIPATLLVRWVYSGFAKR